MATMRVDTDEKDIKINRWEWEDANELVSSAYLSEDGGGIYIENWDGDTMFFLSEELPFLIKALQLVQKELE